MRVPTRAEANKLYIIVPILITLGVFQLFYAAAIQPLRLDERYSLFFALQFPLEHFLFGGPDVHPPGYFVVLRFIYSLTNSLTTLRAVTSIAPYLVGVSVMLWLYRRRIQMVFLITTFFLFNTLLIQIIWQLRMYGFVFLFAALSYAFLLHWQNNKQKRILFFLMIILTLGNMFHYSFFLFAACVLFYLWKTSFTDYRSRRLTILAAVIFTTELFLFTGFNYKETFTYTSWISTVSLLSISNFFLGLFGLTSDLYNQTLHPWTLPVFFMLLVGGFYVYKALTVKDRTRFTYFVIIPVSFTLVFSSFSPLLGKLPLLHRFLPSISLLLPRFLLPFLVILYSLIGEFLIIMMRKRNFISIAIVLIAVLLTIWELLNYQLSLKPKVVADSFEQELVHSLGRRSVLYWPEWLPILGITSSNAYDVVAEANEGKLRSENLKSLLERDTSNTKDVCSVLTNHIIYLQVPEYPNLIVATEKLEASLASCCLLVKRSNATSIWSCY